MNFAPLGLLVDCLSNGPVAREDIKRRQWGCGKVRIGGRARQALTSKERYGVLAFDGNAVYGVTEDYEFNWKEKRIWARMLEIHCAPEGDAKGWRVELDGSLWPRALVSTADALVLALRPAGKKDGELRFLSKADGKTVATVPLAGVPRWDGMAVTEGRVYVATEDGKVVCLAAPGPARP